MTESLIAPFARARFVVTLPPEPSKIGERLQNTAGASFTTLTDTRDAFLHLSRRAQERLVIMTPYIDIAGANWASDLFEATTARNKILILRGSNQIDDCGSAGGRLKCAVSKICDYLLVTSGQQCHPSVETFHAKIILADGAAAYVGSANFLYRSREANLECGFLMEGDAVAPVSVLVDALIGIFDS